MKEEKNKNMVAGFFKYLKSGKGIALFLFLSQIYGYLYMIAQLEFFDISSVFYRYNFFYDFLPLLLTIVLIFLPILLSLFIVWIISYVLICPKKLYKACGFKGVIKLFLIIVGLLILAYILFIFIGSQYNISKSSLLIIYSSVFIVELLIASCIRLFKEKIKINLFRDFQGDMFDLIFIIIVIIAFVLCLGPMIYNLGTSVAEQKRYFPIIGQESEYIVLYCTEEYAIVSEYEIDEDNNSVYILNKNIKKISLDNQVIEYVEFDNVELETKIT